MKRNKHLPLTETTYYVLLAFLKPAHGYLVMQRVEELSHGQVRIAAGTMYGAIENLLRLKWIQALPSQDKRRKVYQITEAGRQIVLLETKRLREISQVAKELGF